MPFVKPLHVQGGKLQVSLVKTTDAEITHLLICISATDSLTLELNSEEVIDKIVIMII